MTNALTGDRGRTFVADTLALVSFFTLTGVLNERFVAGLAWDEVLAARLIGAPLMVITARPYGLYRDIVARHRAFSGKAVFLREAFALSTFQVPIYAAILVLGGAERQSVILGCVGFAALMFLVGRPYGIYLDFVRRAFGVRPAGVVAPMTIGDSDE